MTITAIPPLDRLSATFRADTDTYFASRIPTLTVELNALADDLTIKQGLASAAATAANNDKIATAGLKDTAQFAADAALGYRNTAKTWADAAAASATTIGTTAAFSDANPMIKNATVNTKQGRFKADLITVATIRDYQLPDKSGIMALTTDTGLALVAGPIVPSNSANVDLLNIFTSGFDNYLVIINRVAPSLASAAQNIGLRFANAGVVDSSNIYGSASVDAAINYTNSAIIGPSLRGQDSPAGTIEISISNANSASGLKTAVITNIGGNAGSQIFGGFNSANTVSGFRLYFVSGALFAAGGTVRVYGYKNA